MFHWFINNCCGKRKGRKGRKGRKSKYPNFY